MNQDVIANPDEAVIERIVANAASVIGPVEVVTPVLGGFSPDRKYALHQDGGAAYLLRLTGLGHTAQREEEFHLIRRHHANGVMCPWPHLFGCFEDADVCYSILDYLPGESADIALPATDPSLHHVLGVAAGGELRRIHEMAGTETSEAWACRRWAKYNRYRNRVSESGLEFSGIEIADRFVERGFPLLKDRPVRFQHDDFHPANLIINEGRFGGVIDFNRFDWGDPWEDFYKVPMFTAWTSPAFARGQVAGYFGGPTPDLFWPIYNLYVAMVVSGCIGWAAVAEPAALPYFQERMARLVETHDFEEGNPPAWYAAS